MSQDIIKARWLDDDKATLHDLAAKYNVSAERIRQLEANALKNLKVRLISSRFDKNLSIIGGFLLFLWIFPTFYLLGLAISAECCRGGDKSASSKLRQRGR